MLIQKKSTKHVPRILLYSIKESIEWDDVK